MSVLVPGGTFRGNVRKITNLSWASSAGQFSGLTLEYLVLDQYTGSQITLVAWQAWVWGMFGAAHGANGPNPPYTTGASKTFYLYWSTGESAVRARALTTVSDPAGTHSFACGTTAPIVPASAPDNSGYGSAAADTLQDTSGVPAAYPSVLPNEIKLYEPELVAFRTFTVDTAICSQVIVSGGTQTRLAAYYT